MKEAIRFLTYVVAVSMLLLLCSCSTYGITNGHFANVQIIDNTEPGGNGLVKTTVTFADAKALLD